MKCKSSVGGRGCVLESGHKGRCVRVANGESVANPGVANEPILGSLETDSPRQKRMAANAVEAIAEALTEVARVQKWREANRERYNERQKKLMKEKRARKPLGVPYG